MGWTICFAAALCTLTPVNSLPLPASSPVTGPTEGLSALTHFAGDMYFAVCDKGHPRHLQRLTIGIDRASGAVTNVVCEGTMELAKGDDFEGLAWDVATGWLWAADETDNSIRAFLPTGKDTGVSVDVPFIFQQRRINFGFESLALDAEGKNMWTCNEDALVCDGSRATTGKGSVVRLQRFSRRSPKGAWHTSGQWVYPVDSVAGRDFAHKSRSGVADLLVLDDDSILVLEREMSIRKKAVMPSFRCRLYQVDFAGATDVSTVPSLSRAMYRPVTKRRVFGAQTGFAMFEGMCWGPTLTSGTRTILLISDAGSGAVGCIRSFRLVR